jgi:GntR family transcriptional regulator, transcriptional repressor for pyruvate dehydrogenase complex
VSKGSGRVRVPKVAEIVAEDLRQRILSGELTEGATLSSQDRLLEEVGVSRASMREALRILETEGLITVRRGKRGGAVVHAPGAQISAYTLALSLETGAVTIDDVGEALRRLEASCAALCAARDDRHEAVVAPLTALNERTEEALDDFAKYVEVTAEFHETIVRCCGNATLTMVAGAVESLWLAHVRNWAVEAEEIGVEPSLTTRRQGLKTHRRIVELISRGEAAKVAALVEHHVEPRQFALRDDLGGKPVQASLVRP